MLYVDTQVVRRVKFLFSTRSLYLSGPALTWYCMDSDDCIEVRRKIRLLQKLLDGRLAF